MSAFLYILLLALYSLVNARYVPKRLYSLSNIMAALLAVWFGSAHGLNLELMGLGSGNVVKGLVIGTLVGVPTIIIISIFVFHRKLRDMFVHMPSKFSSDAQAAFELGVRIPFGTALSEEILFRGVLIGLLLPHGTVLAIIISAILFGLWHVIPTLDTILENDAITTFVEGKGGAKGLPIITAVLGTTLVGLIFGWLRVASGSIIAPWIVHLAINMTAVAGGFIAVKRKLPN